MIILVLFKCILCNKIKQKVTRIILITKEPSKCLIFRNRKILGNDNKEVIQKQEDKF